MGRPARQRAGHALRPERGRDAAPGVGPDLPRADYFPGDTDPYEINLDHVIRLEKPAFRGQAALRGVRGRPARRLTTLAVAGDKAARAGRRCAPAASRSARCAAPASADPGPADRHGRDRCGADRPGARFDVELEPGGPPQPASSATIPSTTHTSCALAHDKEDMMAIATRNGAYIGGQWVEGDGERIEVTSPGSGRDVGRSTGLQRGAGGRGRTGRGRCLPGLARHPHPGAGRPLPPRLHAVHGAQRGDRPDDHARDGKDHPRVA